MLSLLSRVRSFFGRKMERGATMVEYSLMVALIAIVLVGIFRMMAESISEVFDEAGVEIKSVL